MLETIKSLVGFDAADTTKDGLLTLLISLATGRLKILIGGLDPPESLNYIIVDVVTARFNRIGSEGLSGHTVEGESLTFKDDDFSGFANDIEKFLEAQQGTTRGRLRFI